MNEQLIMDCRQKSSLTQKQNGAYSILKKRFGMHFRVCDEQKVACGRGTIMKGCNNRFVNTLSTLIHIAIHYKRAKHQYIENGVHSANRYI
jgi:hypothetical protein